MERRLAAILAADVVGYSRMVEADEVVALAALADRRKTIFEPLLAQHRGRVFKLMGDGMLVEFASAVNAVQFAVALQNDMARANAGLPEGQAIVLRIGVNLGDVIIDGLDVQGDGVNVAARLEAMADPGGICISAGVFEQAARLVPVAYEDLGDQTLKNISRPVRVYRVSRGMEAVRGGTGSPIPTKPSIAVLPFTNMSGDPAQAYFSDGITEDIITELARFHRLYVIARNSSFQYRDKAVDVKRVGRDLGVRYVVEGSVRRAGNRIRIAAQLVESETGNHLWAERFDFDQEETFSVQDRIVGTIVGTLVGRLEAADAEQARRKPPASLAAYECVLRGVALPLGDPAVEAERRRFFERAIEIDPGYGLAHAWLAHAVSLEWFNSTEESGPILDQAFGLAKNAVALDENDSVCIDMVGWIHLLRQSFDEAEQYKRKALDLNPNDPWRISSMGLLYSFLGDLDEAFRWFEQSKRVDPYFEPAWRWHALGTAYFAGGRYDEAIAAFSRSTTMPGWLQAYLAACFALSGQVDRAREMSAEVLRSMPGFSACLFARKEPYKRPADRQHLLDGLRRAGLPE